MDMMEIEREVESKSKCLKFLILLWKFIKCIFSHVTLVTLVVAYCMLGAYAFKQLESDYEIQVKKSIKFLRGNVTENLWSLTEKSEILIKDNWINNVTQRLHEFETDILKKMKKEGWDGSEDENNIQWTFAGALFYSIIVITTIGYGHIAPKTQNGKVVTIFYAIIGIPLMLLCLSNIGDVMASCFRFLYWKICCFICTRPPKPRRVRSNNPMMRGSSIRQGSGRMATPRGTSFRRSIRTSQRSADSDNINRMTHLNEQFKDELPRRFDPANNDNSKRLGSPGSTASPRSLQVPSSMRHTYDPTPRTPRTSGRSMATQSLDRRLMVTHQDVDKTPVLFNKYALDKYEVDCEDDNHPANSSHKEYLDQVSTSSVHFNNSKQPRRCRSVDPSWMSRPRTTAVTAKNSRSNVSYTHQRRAPSPRIMSPMGLAVHRQTYNDDFEFDDYLTSVEDQIIKPVPIWLCVFLVVSYILGGAVLFTEWEKWMFLDSAYFCFITLTTIGFGDFVPAHKLNAHQGIILCSLYLLFGIALLAMSFNLVQEEVITNVKNVAKRLGIIKEEDDDDDDDDVDDDDFVVFDDFNVNNDADDDYYLDDENHRREEYSNNRFNDYSRHPRSYYNQ